MRLFILLALCVNPILFLFNAAAEERVPHGAASAPARIDGARAPRIPSFLLNPQRQREWMEGAIDLALLVSHARQDVAHSTQVTSSRSAVVVVDGSESDFGTAAVDEEEEEATQRS